MNKWFQSIEDDTVRGLAMKNTIVTGGCIASMLLKEPVNDFDVYFRNRETALAVAKYYIDRFKITNKNGIDCPIFIDEDKTDRVEIIVKSSGIASEAGSELPYQYFESAQDPADANEYINSILAQDEVKTEVEPAEKPKYRPVYMSSNAITLSDDIQIITRFFGDPAEIHENYDFVHCTNYWTSWDNKCITNKAALEALLAKELKYVGSKYPLASLIRIRKFIQRGWTINAGQILKAVMQLQRLDLSDVDTLKDQLTGVDVAYFNQVIHLMKERDQKHIEHTYLVEVIDRLFG